MEEEKVEITIKEFIEYLAFLPYNDFESILEELQTLFDKTSNLG